MAECFLPDVYIIGGDEGDDTPTDDNTHLWYKITARTTKKAYVLIGRSSSWGSCSLQINWGDGSTNTQSNNTTNFSFTHTYAEYGDYHIIISRIAGTGSYSVSYSSYPVSGSNEPGRSQVVRIHYGRYAYASNGNYRDVLSLRKLTFHSDMQGKFGYSNYMFIGSTGITEITLPKGVDSIIGDAFRESPLATLSLLREGVVSLGITTAFYSINHSLKIYVPDIIWDAG